MKKIICFIILCIMFLVSCERMSSAVKESYRYGMYIDFKNISYQGQNRTQKIYFEIDSTHGMFYRGKLIMNDKDTVGIGGFKKGSIYYTSYKGGQLSLWTRVSYGQIPDTLYVQEKGTATLIREKTILLRRPRGCR